MNEKDISNNFRLDWIVEGQILRLEIKTQSNESMLLCDQMMIELFDKASQSVDLVVIVPLNDAAPPSFKSMTRLKSFQHPRLGYTAIVGVKINPIVRILMTSIASLRGVKIRAFETLEQGLAFLAAVHQP